MRKMTKCSLMGAVLAISVGFAQGGGASPPSPNATDHDETPCRGYRWEQKVLRDPAAQSIDLRHRNRSVTSLTSVEPPLPLPLQRQGPYEYETYRVKARVVKVWKPRDGDLHVVIKAQGHTMITEIPHWRCTAGSRLANLMLEARRTVRRQYRGPGQCVRLTGVGFWDLRHNRASLREARNGFELHPVLWARLGRRNRRTC